MVYGMELRASFTRTVLRGNPGYTLLLFGMLTLFMSGCSMSPLYTPKPVPAPQPVRVPPRPESGVTIPPESIPTNRENVRIISPEDTTGTPAPAIHDSSPQHVASLELVDVGRRNIESGNIDQGIDMLERAISLDAYNSRAYYYLSVAWLRKNQPSRALEFARKAELLCQGKKRELKKIYLLESDIYRKLGNSDKADMYQWKAREM